MVGIRMTGKSALVVIEVQQGVLETSWNADTVVSRIATLIDRARDEGVPVIHVQHEVPSFTPLARGSGDWQIDRRVAPAPGEVVVPKQFQDAFANTRLADVLDAMDVTHLVFAGAQTDASIHASIVRAMMEGWQVTLVSDGHTTGDCDVDGVRIPAAQIVKHLNASIQHLEYPGRSVEVVAHQNVEFSVPVIEGVA